MADLTPQGSIFDEVVFYEANLDGMNPWKALGLLRQLRLARFDTLVYLAPGARTRWQVLRDLTFFRAAGITHFFGHRGFESLPPHVPGSELPFLEHEIDHLLSRLEVTGIPVPSIEERRIDLALTGEELAAAHKWLADRLAPKDMAKILAVGPGSNWPSKIWPEERYVELVRVLAGELGVYPVVFGGSELHALGERLIAAWGCGLNAAGQLSVRQAAAALSHCKVFVGNDTGTMHLAAAAGTPCVGIYAAVGWPGRSYPYGRGHRVLRRSLPCEGCLLHKCIEHAMECLKLISVNEAAAACRTALAERGIRARESAVPASR